MVVGENKTLRQGWLRRIEAIARCAWLLALVLVAGTALSRAHAEDRLLRVDGVQVASNPAENVDFDVWGSLEATTPGRMSLPEAPAATFLDPALEDELQDVGGPEDAEAEATPEAIAPGHSKLGGSRNFPFVGEAPLRSVVRGLYAARAPPHLA